MLSTVARFMAEHGLAPRGTTLLAGVSGGPDSMAMLDVLDRLRGSMGFDLACATVDHGLRQGTEREAALVEREARARSIPWTLLAGDARRAAGGGPEEAARWIRLELLERRAAEAGASRIALGHTLDDQAETVILRLMRGTGLHGLASMRPVRDDTYIRPLLGVPRARVRAYLEQRAIPWIEDPSNADPRYARNRVRAEILPALEECRPGASRLIASMAVRAREASAAVDVVVRELVGRIAERRDGAWRVDRVSFQELEPAIRPFVLRRILADLKGDTRGLGRRHFEAVLGILSSGHGSASVDLPAGIRVVRSYDEVLVERGGGGADGKPDEGVVRVDGPGVYGSGPIEVDVRCDGPGGPFPLELRRRRTGDRLAGRTRTLGRLLIDVKVPRRLRASVPLLAAGTDVVWAGGLYLARGAGIDVAMRPQGRSLYLEWYGSR
jgi:tRNA(Ile)-lysidine synthase